MSFVLVSSAFKDDGYIPPWYCATGSDCSPPIGWTTPPLGTKDAVLFDGALHGRNSLGNLGWDGPGIIGAEEVLHFTLSALDTIISLEGGATAEEVDAAMSGHVLGTARLVGHYKPH
jgi:phosphatidylethanolamine-binding protein (PEBP) family uncharacterized protein